MAVVGVPLPVLHDPSQQKTQIVVSECSDIYPTSNCSVEDLTLEEKLDMLSGFNFTHTNSVSRLGIPTLKIVDTITGVKGNENLETPTLCFPSATCMGATWNCELLGQVGSKLALQAKSKSAQVLLGPVLNLHRDPRGGRNFESFSEDPLLAGELAASLVNAIQTEGIAVCPKHFVGNESETKRRFHNVAEPLDGRAMREIYLAAWQVLLRKSDPAAIMAAYNKVGGVFCSENSKLIKKILRDDWGYKGLVMSDWYGTRSSLPALEAGLDLEMPGPTIFRGLDVLKKIRSGEFDVSILNQRVAAVLKLVQNTKESQSSTEETSFFDEASNSLARQVGTEGIVLLQNRKSVLPLRKTQSLAVVGSQATEPSISGGGSAAAPPQYIKRPLDTIKMMCIDPKLVREASGVRIHNVVPIVRAEQVFAKNGCNGINVRYFNDGADSAIIDEFQQTPQVVMFGKIKEGLNSDGFHYEISATLIPKTTGCHTIGTQATGSCSLKVNGNEIASKIMTNIEVEDFLFRPQNLQVLAQVQMTAGVPYFVELIVQPHKPAFVTGEPIIHSAKLCYMEEYSDDDDIATAVSIAEKADVTLLFAGRTAEHESEGFDAPDMLLPPNQIKMIKAVAAVSRRTVLILSCGNPIDVQDFVDDVDAIVNAHFLGQEGGSALADILFGEACPSGKLAVSWPKRLKDSPSFPYYPATETPRGWEITCGEGVGVGYRHGWENTTLQWPFGFGLSYTTFEISSLVVSRCDSSEPTEDGEIAIKAVLTNTGKVDGAEVVQVYVEDTDCSVPRPWRELKGFLKVAVQAQTSVPIKISMKEKYAFSFWNEVSKRWTAEAGEFRIHVGKCVASVKLDRGFSWSGL